LRNWVIRSNQLALHYSTSNRRFRLFLYFWKAHWTAVSFPIDSTLEGNFISFLPFLTSSFCCPSKHRDNLSKFIAELIILFIKAQYRR
jgi:hypothetical protein